MKTSPRPEPTEADVEGIDGEPLRFRVRSSSFPNAAHIVDLSEHGGSGLCLCTDFLLRREVAIKQGAPLFTRQTQCKHILAAREFLLNNFLRAAAKQLKPPPPYEPDRTNQRRAPQNHLG